MKKHSDSSVIEGSGNIFGVSQPDVSRLSRGILNDFSIDRLLVLLGRLSYRVTIRLEAEDEKPDDILVSA